MSCERSNASYGQWGNEPRLDDQKTIETSGDIIDLPRKRPPSIRSPRARRALFVFLAGCALLAAVAFVPLNTVKIILVLVALLLMMVFGAIFVVAVLWPDMIEFKKSGWRYSLRTLLVLITAAAFAFGLIQILKSS